MIKKKIGFFGGTFDPIHFGHLRLADGLAREHHLDEVWVCPAYCSVFKTASPPEASVEDRLAMIRLAIEDYPLFKLCLFEIERRAVCYTVDTLQSLAKPNIEFYLLLSEESFQTIALWKDYKELLALAPPLVGKRTELSSTMIRERLKQKISCKNLLPAKVLDYIIAHRVYSVP